MSGLGRSSGEPPPQIELRASGIDPETLGIWSKLPISVGDSFGPFEGERVQEAHPDMDPSYVWEIVDLESKEHLWYIDATDPSHGNWMRNIKCARFLEEQNIISMQEGTDIYYKAMKDIPTGMELLTWYERVHLKRGRKRRKNPTPQPTGKPLMKSRRREGSQDESSNDLSSDEAWFPSKKTKRQLMRELSQSSLKSCDSGDKEITASTDGKGEDLADSHQDTSSPVAQEYVKSESVGGERDQRSESVEKMADQENLEDGYFHFEMKEEYIIRNRLGKKVFICDICSGLYKHSFSLKRHYIKHHINHKYVSEADLQSCTVTKVSVISNESSSIVPTTTSQKCSENSVQENSSNDSKAVIEKDVQNSEECSSKEKNENSGSHGSNENTGVDSSVQKYSHGADESFQKCSPSIQDGTEQVHSDITQEVNESEKVESAADSLKNDRRSNHYSSTVKSSQLPEAVKGDRATDTMQSSESLNQITEDNHSYVNSDSTNLDLSKINAGNMNSGLVSKTTHDNTGNQILGVPDGQNNDLINESKGTLENECSENSSEKRTTKGKEGEVCVQLETDEMNSKSEEKESGDTKLEDNSRDDKRTDLTGKSIHVGSEACIPMETYSKEGGSFPDDDNSENTGHIKKGDANNDSTFNDSQSGNNKSDLTDPLFPDALKNKELCGETSEIATRTKERSYCVEIDESVKPQRAIDEPEKCHTPSESVPNHSKTGTDHSENSVKAPEYLSDSSNKITESNATNAIASKYEPSIVDESQNKAASLAMPGLYRCHTCSATFDLVASLRDHIKEHPSEMNAAKVLPCDQCDMMFSEKKALAQHQAVHNKTDTTPKTSSKSNTSSTSSNTPPSTSAKGQKKCRYCGKQFPSTKNLRRHERVHEGIRVTCEHCALSFTQGSDLKKHIRRLHPTSFHECGFCTRYFSSKKLLVEHLQSHNKNMQSNRDQLDSKKDHLKAIDPILDKAESMRLAGKRYNRGDDNAFKFACTVCKKRFIDYSNMCRHRRLAHLRHLMDTVKTSERRNERIFESTSIIRTRSAVEREMVDFYANVSDNIQDNLSNHMMGTKSMLDNASDLIKWGLKETNGTSFDYKKDHEQKSTSIPFLSKFNFPKPFRLKDPDHRYREVNRRDPKYNTFSLMKDKTDEDPAEMEAAMTSSAKSNNQFEIYDEYTLPKPVDISSYSPKPKEKSAEHSTLKQDNKTCAVCKITFDTYKEFRFHMRDEHSVNAYDIKQGEVGQGSNAGSDGATENKNNNQGRKPDINIPVTLQHDKPEQDDVIDLSHEQQIQNRVPKSGKLETAKMGMLNLKANSRVVSAVPRSVCTEDPSEKFHRYLCNACNTEFGDWRQFVDHHYAKHPTIERGFSIIDPNLKQVWTRVTNPVGLLNVCSAHLPGLEPRQHFHCTKCHRRFKAMEDLHKHILECADPETFRPKYVWVYQYRKQKYSKLKKKRTCEWQKSSNTPKKVVPSDGQGATSSEHNSQTSESNVVNDKGTDNLNGELLDSEFFDDGKRRRRKPFEIVYNPNRHTRRREMTEIVDTSICGGCGEDFKTISVLERHIPLCSNKDKICELESLKSVYQADHSDSDSSDDYDPSKHLCIYCEKQFTYMGSLRNHIYDVCNVRKDLVKNDEYLDEEWEQDLIDKTGGKRESLVVEESSMSPSREDENSKDSEDLRKSIDRRQRRRRRGFGWAPPKAKSNAYNKHIKHVVSEDGFVYEYFVESEVPIISFDLSDTFILDVDKTKEDGGNKRKKVTKRQSVEVFESETPETLTTTPPYVPLQVLPHQDDGTLPEDLSKPPEKKSKEPPVKKERKNRKQNVKASGPKKEPSSNTKKGKDSMKSVKITNFMKVKKKDTTVTKRTSPGKRKVSPLQTKRTAIAKGTSSQKRKITTKTMGAKALAKAKSSRTKVTSRKTKEALAKCVKKKIAQRNTRKQVGYASKTSKVTRAKKGSDTQKQIAKKTRKPINDAINKDDESVGREQIKAKTASAENVGKVTPLETVKEEKLQSKPEIRRRKTAAKFLTTLKSKQIQKKANAKTRNAAKEISKTIARQRNVTRINNVIQVRKRARKSNAIAKSEDSYSVIPDKTLDIYNFVGESSSDETLPEKEMDQINEKSNLSYKTVTNQNIAAKLLVDGVKRVIPKTKLGNTLKVGKLGELKKTKQIETVVNSKDAIPVLEGVEPVTINNTAKPMPKLKRVKKVKQRTTQCKVKEQKQSHGRLKSRPKRKFAKQSSQVKTKGKSRNSEISSLKLESSRNKVTEIAEDSTLLEQDSIYEADSLSHETNESNETKWAGTKSVSEKNTFEKQSKNIKEGVNTDYAENIPSFEHSAVDHLTGYHSESKSKLTKNDRKFGAERPKTVQLDSMQPRELSKFKSNLAKIKKSNHGNKNEKSSKPKKTKRMQKESAVSPPFDHHEQGVILGTVADDNMDLFSPSPQKTSPSWSSKTSLATMLDALNEAALESSLQSSTKAKTKKSHKHRHRKRSGGECDTVGENSCAASSDKQKQKKRKRKSVEETASSFMDNEKTATKQERNHVTMESPVSDQTIPDISQGLNEVSDNKDNASIGVELHSQLNFSENNSKHKKRAMKRKLAFDNSSLNSEQIEEELTSDVTTIEEAHTEVDRNIDRVIALVAHGSPLDPERNGNHVNAGEQRKKKNLNDIVPTIAQNGFCVNKGINSLDRQSLTPKPKKRRKAESTGKKEKIPNGCMNGVADMLPKTPIKQKQNMRSASNSRTSSPASRNTLNKVNPSPDNVINVKELNQELVATKLEALTKTNGASTILRDRESKNIFDTMEKLSPESKHVSRDISSSPKQASRNLNASPVRSTRPSLRKNGAIHENSNSSNNHTFPTDSIDLVTNTVCKAIHSSPSKDSNTDHGSALSNPVSATQNTALEDTTVNSEDERDPWNDSFGLVMDTVDSGDYSDATETYSEYGEGEDGQSKRLGEFNGMALL